MHRLEGRTREQKGRGGVFGHLHQVGGTVVARSSVVATLILLFLAYLVGTTPPTPAEGPIVPPAREESGVSAPGSDAERPALETEPGSERRTGSKAGDGRSTGPGKDGSGSGLRPTALPLAGKTIVVDPGHGGWDPGAIGISGATRESYNTLFVAQDVQKLLEAAGARVVMTRKVDTFVSLDARVAVANNSGADIFVSIHNDSNPNASVRGVTTYYYTAQSRRLAETMQAALSAGLGARSVGVFQRPFVVVRGPWMPAVLVELGFLTNWTDERLLGDPGYRYRAAEAIYNGILRYFEGA